jgi:hypothetical protein
MPEDKETKNAAPEPASQAQPPVQVVIQQQDRAGEAARSMLEGRALAMDTADVPGGRYLVNGKEVNANGHPVGSPLNFDAPLPVTK